MRGTSRSSESMTMVIRDTPGRSVCPTVSDSMLKPRRRMSDVTRVSTPGRSSTWTMKVVCMTSRIGARFRDWARAPDHLVQRRSGGHHRVHGVFLLDLKIDDDGFTRTAGRFDGGNDVGTTPHRKPAEPVRLRQLDEVRTEQRRRGIAALVEELLPLAD